MSNLKNKDFWEKSEVIQTQDQKEPKATDFEKYLYKKASKYFFITRKRV